MPVSSMTGFGSAERAWEDGRSAAPRRLVAEVRSVNARFLELKLRQPFGPAVEARLRKRVERVVGRGRVELRVFVDKGPSDPAADAGGSLDARLAQHGIDAESLGDLVSVIDDVRRTAGSRGVEIGVPNVLEVLGFLQSANRESSREPEAPAWLDELVDEALGSLAAMREAEGRALEKVLGEQLVELETARREIGALASAEPDRLLSSFVERLEVLSAAASAPMPDRDRIASEVAVLVTRGDVTEELDRIDSHLEQARAVLAQPAKRGQGKTLDFLSQEFLREFTTVGAKVTAHESSAKVIAAKGTIERFREQVQNVE